MSEERRTINESADKIRLSTKVKRGSDVRDQDEISVNVRGDDPDEAVAKLAATLDALEDRGVAQGLRSTQPETPVVEDEG